MTLAVDIFFQRGKSMVNQQQSDKHVVMPGKIDCHDPSADASPCPGTVPRVALPCRVLSDLSRSEADERAAMELIAARALRTVSDFWLEAATMPSWTAVKVGAVDRNSQASLLLFQCN